MQKRLKRLPIGIQTFSEIIEGNYYYVDKTRFALDLINRGKYYFLSRPRRFGKSLFLDTLAELFQANKKLFKGLYIETRYDFVSYPVIRISFGSGDYFSEDNIIREIEYILKINQEQLQIKCSETGYQYFFRELIRKTQEHYASKVVILVDEYDKPIIDNIRNSQIAERARAILRNFYGAIKDCDRYIKFVFITGVSKFSKLNLFSGLNNLEDITIDTRYAEICGYTQNELKTVFADALKGADWAKLKKWYNGYNYFGDKLYNPYDVLLFISKNFEFRNYWWSTGNPQFLLDKLKEWPYYIPEVENAVVSEETLEAFDIEYIDLVALLWQTGYLTFDQKIINDLGRIKYKLKIPNLEIQFSLNELFANYLTGLKHGVKYNEVLANAILKGKVEDFIQKLKELFASIPYTTYANNIISQYEGYYTSVVYTYLMALGFDVIPEDITNKGRIDLTIKTKDRIWIIEFKVDADESPLKQIKEKKYFEKYFGEKKEIYLLGINFDTKEKNIKEYDVEIIRA